MKLLILVTLTGLTTAFPNKFYNVVPGKIQKDAVSTDVSVENTALGSCICDITANSCDTYCCCDPDCDADILKFWNANYD